MINRGSQSQIIIGPKKMSYNQENGEYRVIIHDVYYGLIVSSILFQTEEQNIIEIFITDVNDTSF